MGAEGCQERSPEGFVWEWARAAGRGLWVVPEQRGRAEPVRCENNRNRRETGLENGWHVSAAQSIGKGKNRSESFTFSSLPTNLSELQALPESTLDSPFKTAALTLACGWSPVGLNGETSLKSKVTPPLFRNKHLFDFVNYILP